MLTRTKMRSLKKLTKKPSAGPFTHASGMNWTKSNLSTARNLWRSTFATNLSSRQKSTMQSVELSSKFTSNFNISLSNDNHRTALMRPSNRSLSFILEKRDWQPGTNARTCATGQSAWILISHCANQTQPRRLSRQTRRTKAHCHPRNPRVSRKLKNWRMKSKTLWRRKVLELRKFDLYLTVIPLKVFAAWTVWLSLSGTLLISILFSGWFPFLLSLCIYCVSYRENKRKKGCSGSTCVFLFPYATWDPVTLIKKIGKIKSMATAICHGRGSDNANQLH